MQDIFVMAMTGLIGVSLFVIAYEIYIDISFKNFCNILNRMRNENSNRYINLLIELNNNQTDLVSKINSIKISKERAIKKTTFKKKSRS